MSIRRIQCPGCDATLNVAATMTNVKCPTCATVWNVGNPSAAQISVTAKQMRQAAEPEPVKDKASTQNMAIVAGLVGGAMVLLAFIGLTVMMLGQSPPPSAASTEPEETIKPRQPQPYRVVKLPEEQRMRIYADYRTVARTTVETPLILPQGTRARKSLEVMLEKTYDRELVAFAALHDIEVDDVQEIIKEGDAKVWDDRPRSNAVRDGKRVYSKEMSEGWEKNPNVK
ncbi:hypothetical protein Poly51_57400 [Rubripirellula tenax]|uniref:Uncharacterized protein n=1 Tax=Rubripirellula tenax TaxID=2528015 RepID=A0A5C6ED03_9BACT|nr:hypothetical protein [Rubripirellula tenax]TWU46344.1 hypothetical protein Poly51_57400 [Rubripirellula tenax]